MRRRSFLTGTGAAAVGLAGCSSINPFADDEKPRHYLAPQEARIRSDSSQGRISETSSATFELEEGMYTVRTLDPTRSIEFYVEWETNGKPIDVYFLDEWEYNNRWRERDQDLQVYTGLTQTGRSQGSVSDVVNRGNYVLIFSNSGVYGTSPDGTVTVSYYIELTLSL